MSTDNSALYRYVDAYFQVSARDSSFRTEVAAGISTFMSLSYIFVIHPFILGMVGLNPHIVLVLTVLVSAAASVASGFWTRLPFVFAPGLEMSLYIALVAISLLSLTPSEVFGLVIICGIMLCCLGHRRVRHYLIDSVPHHFTNAVAITMAAFLLSIALSFIGLGNYQSGHLTIGLSLPPNGGWAITGLVAIILCELLGIRPSVLIGIMVVVFLAHSSGSVTSRLPTPAVRELTRTTLQAIKQPLFSFADLFKLKSLLVLFTLFVLSSFGSLSKLIKLSKDTTIVHRGDIPRLNSMFVLDGLAAIASGATGNSNLTTFVESGVGISIGGRTGITSIIAGILMLSAVGLLPIIRFVSPAAIAGALVFVGVQFVPNIETLKDMWIGEKLTTAVMTIIVVLWRALGVSFVVGLALFFSCALASPASERHHEKDQKHDKAVAVTAEKISGKSVL